MSDNEPVCECGHGMIAHENGNNCLVRINQWTPTYCPCEQFTDARLATLRAQLAVAQERVKALEGERFLLRQILHDIAFFSLVADGRLHNEYENGWNEAAETITQAAQKHFTDKGILADDFDKLDEQLAQRDAEIVRLEKDQQWLDPSAVELIKAFGSFSIERLPDWNFAVSIDGAIYGIGMTVFDAISSAATQIDKIEEARKEGGE